MELPFPFLEQVTVVGANDYVGRHLIDELSLVANQVIACTSTEQPPTWQAEQNIVQHALPDAAAYDSAFQQFAEGPIIMLSQLQRPSIDWMLDRIDGPRWIVFSSAQLGATELAPGHEVAASREQVAVQRGATVIRPTMIFGRGGDRNLTTVMRTVARTRVPMQLGDGSQSVQPIHVDDLIGLLLRAAHVGGKSGIFEAGCSEQISLRELMVMMAQLLGVRAPMMSVPNVLLRGASAVAPIAGIRSDQIRRLVEDKVVEDKVVDNSAAMSAFDWHPAPLAHRLEQAVGQAGLGPRVSAEEADRGRAARPDGPSGSPSSFDHGTPPPHGREH